MRLLGRSTITNGTNILPYIDGRSTWTRRLKDLIDLHQNDLGGADNISTAEASIIRRAATLTVELEHLEAKFMRQGEAGPAQLMLYQRVANTHRRLLEAIGLQRRPRDVTPSLNDYLRTKTFEGEQIDVEVEAAE